MDIKKGHTPQFAEDDLYQIKQDAFFRIYDQVDNIHHDTSIPPMLKNISLYLEGDKDTKYTPTAFGGIYEGSTYSVLIKEYVKYNNDNWVVFVNIFNNVEKNEEYVTDLNLENSFAQIKKIAIGCVDGAIMIAPGESQRVISLSTDFKTKKIRVNNAELREFMNQKDETSGYKLNEFETGVYLVDSPAPLFGKDTVEYRDAEYVGLWISFGTLLKYDLTNLNVFNIDGTKVGAIDKDATTLNINILKLLTNVAYGYASIIFNKEAMLKHLMDYSKRYLYETNMQDQTQICVENLLQTLQTKGLFGLLYEEFTAVEEFPMIAYDESAVEVVSKRATVLKFRYKNEYIYMLLDIPNNKMYFASYAGKIRDYENEKYGYNIKVMNDLWVTKANNITPDNFVLFTGFPNLQHNKVIDIYFDNTTENFSDIDKEFSIDVNEFDSFYEENTNNPGDFSYERNKDLLHVYGNNPFPLVSGALGYEFDKIMDGYTPYYKLAPNSEPMLSTIIDAERKKIYLMSPSMKMNAMRILSTTEMRVWAFINNYITRFLQGEDIHQWIEEADGGGFGYTFTAAFYSNGWTTIKEDDNKYTCIKTSPIRILYKYSGSVATESLRQAEKGVEKLQALMEAEGGVSNIEEKAIEEIDKRTRLALNGLRTGIKSLETTFTEEVMKKNTILPQIVEVGSPRFDFDRYEGSDDIFINNRPTGPVLNHCLFFEDTFKNLFQNFRDEYLSTIDVEVPVTQLYCPYFKSVQVTSKGLIVHAKVASDLSNSIEILKNTKIGVSSIGDIVASDGMVDIAGERMRADEAYSNSLDIAYIGIKTIDDVDMSLYRMFTTRQMSDRARDAYQAEFMGMANNLSSDIGIDFEQSLREVQENIEEDLNAELVMPDIPTSKAIYVAVRESKVLVSLNGEDFMSPPLDNTTFNISARFTVEDKGRFLSHLRNMIHAQINKIRYKLHSTGTHKTDDIYSVGIDDVWIDTATLHNEGYVDVKVIAYPDNGQVVLNTNTDLIYNTGERFEINKRIDIDGFNPSGTENIKILLDVDFEYYMLLHVDNETTYDTAMEFMLQDSCYLTKLSLPISLIVPRKDFVYVTKTEATQQGVQGWFNFNA